jgi:hypothetical protein
MNTEEVCRKLIETVDAAYPPHSDLLTHFREWKWPGMFAVYEQAKKAIARIDAEKARKKAEEAPLKGQMSFVEAVTGVRGSCDPLDVT